MGSSVEEKTWTEFSDAGLLWWVNRSLHLFGWAIVMEENPITGEVVRCYPARVSYRGFTEEMESLGFARVRAYMIENFGSKKKE